MEVVSGDGRVRGMRNERGNLVIVMKLDGGTMYELRLYITNQIFNKGSKHNRYKGIKSFLETPQLNSVQNDVIVKKRKCYKSFISV